MKKFLLILGGVIVTLFAAILIVPSFFDWNSQKPRISAVASDALGQPVEIAGDLSLSLLPSPRLKAKQLRIGDENALAQGPALKAESLAIEVALFPLFSGRIDVSSIRLIEPDIKIMTGGLHNTDVEPGPTQSSETPDISLPRVEIENGSITVIDADTGAQNRVSNINLDIAAQSVDGPFSAEGDILVQGLPLDLSIQTGNITRPDFPFEARIQSDQYGGLSFSLVGGATDIIGDTPQASGQLNITAGDLGDALAAFSPQQPNDMLARQSFSLKTPFTWQADKISISGLVIDVGKTAVDGTAEIDLSSDIPRIAARLTSPLIDLGPFMPPEEPDAPLLDALEFDIPADIALQADLQISALEGLSFPVQNVVAKVVLQGGKAAMSLQQATLPGGVQLTAQTQLETKQGLAVGPLSAKLQGANGQTLLRTFMGPDAALPPAPIAISMDAAGALTQEGLNVRTLIATVGDTDIKGTASLSYGKTPSAALTAQIGTLNLDHWTQSAPTSTVQRADSGEALSLGRLDLDVRMDSILRAGERFDGVRVSGTLIDDQFSIKEARIGSPQSALVTASGTVANLSADAQTLDLTFAVDARSTNALLALAGQPPNDTLDKLGNLAVSGQVKGTSITPDVTLGGRVGDTTLQIGSQLNLKDPETLIARGTARITQPNPAALLAKLEMLEATSVGAAPGPTQVTADFALDGQTQNIQAKLLTPSGNGQLQMSSGPNSRKFTSTLKADSLIQLAKGVGLNFDPAGARLGAVDITLAASGTAERLSITQLGGQFGPASLEGTGQVNLAGDIPVVDLVLKGRNIDLAAILPEAQTGAQQVAQGTGERWSKEPLDLSALESLDGSLTLDLDRLTWQGYELTDAQLAMQSTGRNLRVGLNRGALFGGPASLQLSLDGGNQTDLALDFSIKNGSIEKASLASAAVAPLTGKLDIEGSFRSSGASEYTLVESLSGRGSIAAREGVINGVDIPRINARFANLGTVADFVKIAGSALRGGQTAYDVIAVDYIAENGQISTRNMRTQIDGGAQASLNASINLPAWQIKANGAFSLADHPEAPPVGLTMTGSIDAPQINYQLKAIQDYIGVRLGAAVLKGIVRGEGVSLSDFIGTKNQDEAQTQPTGSPQEPSDLSGQNQNTGSNQPAEQAPPKRPEEQIRDLILEGLFGGKKKNP